MSQNCDRNSAFTKKFYNIQAGGIIWMSMFWSGNQDYIIVSAFVSSGERSAVIEISTFAKILTSDTQT